MRDAEYTRVVGDAGLKGIILGPSTVAPDEVAIELEDGREISVPASSLTRQPDGAWYLHREAASSSHVIDAVVPVIAEELEIDKRKTKTGAVRVTKQAVEHDETISMPLQRERAEVKRVIINRPVDGPLAVRREGDTIIMPIVEEVPVVEKRLMLKEEIHVTRRKTTEHHDETVTLRREQADVRRLDASGTPVSSTIDSRTQADPGPTHVLPPEERSILDPTKRRSTVLRTRRKDSARRNHSLK
jgi:uncharacterized protein (TIGR02271 family)